MDIEELASLLKRYHDGKCSPEERRIVEDWYDSLPGSTAPPDEAEIAESLNKIRGRLSQLTGWHTGLEPGPEEIQRRPPAGVLRRISVIALTAAAALVLFIAAYWTMRLMQRQDKDTFAGVSPAGIRVATVSGEIRHVLLPDGSVVVLNANSHLEYPAHFGSGNREVMLSDGEAYFQVAPDPSHPFVVTAGGLKTTVLGTSFNIRTYVRDAATVLALVTGKVSVSAEGAAPVALDPGKIITLNRATGATTYGHFDDAEDIIGWEEMAIHFQDASFDDIAFELENTYGIRMRNVSSKKHWSYTGYFAHENVREIIRTICITENLDFTSGQNQFILINKK
jgi:transmembrane sensor